MDILTLLTTSYTESHRHYHNLNHVADMFLTSKRNQIPLTEEQVYAIWFHDVVYEVGKTGLSNEQASANVAVKVLKELGWETERINIVRDIILSTEKEEPLIEEAKIVIDLDLWALSNNNYFSNGVNIKREYLSSFTSEEFDKGRVKWIDSMLAKEKIYHSDYATEEMEKTARKNLLDDRNSLQCQ